MTATPAAALAVVEAALGRALGAELNDARVRFVVAFSGGTDSTVLLAALLRRVEAARVRVVHVDHGLHPDSADWARRCRAVAARLGVAADVRRVEVETRGNREAQARRARYRVFADSLADGERLLLAHHADDQAETLLWRLVRGRLLRGMPVRRPLRGGWLVRPLLEVPRHVLGAAAPALDLPTIEDPSNRDLTFDRNYLRHEILPRLAARWPDVVARLTDQALRLERDAQATRMRSRDEATAWTPDLLPWHALHADAPRRARVRGFVERAGGPPVPENVLDELERQLSLQSHADVGAPSERAAKAPVGATAGRDGPENSRPAAAPTPFARTTPATGMGARPRIGVQISPSWRLVGSVAGIALRRVAAAPEPGRDAEPESDFPPRSWTLPRTATATRTDSILVGTFRLTAHWTGPAPAPAMVVEVRPRRGGERLRPAGRGGSRSVKRLLQEAGVPRARRSRYPLLYAGDRLVVVPGVAVDESAADRFATDVRTAPAGRFVIAVEAVA